MLPRYLAQSQQRSALVVALVYALFAAIWILVSDTALFAIFGEVAKAEEASKFKGLGFVLVTSALLFILINQLWQQHASLLTSQLELLRVFVEQAPAAIAMFDRDMRYIAVSRRWLGDYKLVNQDLIGRSHYDVFPELPANWKAVHQLGMQGESRSAESDRFERPDGSVLWLKWEMHPWHVGPGQVGGIVIMSEDITHQVMADEKLRLQGLVLDQIQDHVTITDLQGVVTYCNAAEQSALKLARVGEHVSSYGEGNQADATQQEIVDATLREGRWEGAVVNQRADGSEILLDLRTTLIKDTEGNPVAMVGVGTDITERKRSEEELSNHRQNLERLVEDRTRELVQAKNLAETANIAKSAFLANMSHEIRTPLNAITGMAHLMRRSGLSAQQTDKLDKIEAAGNHLLEIINAILDLSKIEAGKFSLEETLICVDEVLENVASMVGEKARAKGLTLKLEMQPMPEGLLGDRTRLRQALLNYATNAVKFTAHGSVTLRTFLVEENPDNVLIRFEVTDTGTGIAPEAMPRLFSAFEQADNSITRKYGGTGLGLAITRRIAELMGGKTGVTSEPGKGSTFWLTLRLKKTDTQCGTASMHAIADAENALRTGFSGTRILLAEDEPINREVTLSLLDDVGLVTDTAEDGAQAIKLAQQNDYALILMDMQMPNMDGLEATRRIRQLPDRHHVPILAMTANAFAEDKLKCFEAGMDDFISKPVIPATLFVTMLHWLKINTSA